MSRRRNTVLRPGGRETAGTLLLAALGLLTPAFGGPPARPPLPTPCLAGNCGSSASSFVTYGAAGEAVSGKTMNVVETTSQAILNWANFNISNGYSVNFIQPSATASVLNKIWSADPSVIAGAGKRCRGRWGMSLTSRTSCRSTQRKPCVSCCSVPTIAVRSSGARSAWPRLRRSQDTFYRLFERFERITNSSFFTLPTGRRSGSEAETVSKRMAGYFVAFIDAMNDDFNTGGAVAALFDLVTALNRHADTTKLDAARARTRTWPSSARACRCYGS